MRHDDRSASAEQNEIIANMLIRDLDPNLGPAEVERVLKRRVTEIGAVAFGRILQGAAPTERFVEDGVTWSPAVVSALPLMTLFGPVRVERTLFRSRRNGPTRCVLGERLGLVGGFWTPEAAKIGALTIAEMPMERAAEFLSEIGVAPASRSSLLRLGGTVSELWEDERAAHEQALREAATIPPEAAAVAVSLDGVMVTLVDSKRAKVKAAARARGQPDKGPAGFSEASVGVITFYDSDGRRIATRRYGRMPEEGKETTKAWLRAEIEHIRSCRPDLTVVAIADGAANFWAFLGTLGADYEVVDFFHTADHLHRHVSRAAGAATRQTQHKLHLMRRQLLEDADGPAKVFAQLEALRKRAGTEPPSTRKRAGKRQPTYFERHHARMAYADLLSQKLPIGSGVTESTCKLAVCDRLRRTGMRWSVDGGQAVLSLRVLRINGEFDDAWKRLMAANRARMAA